MRKAQKEILSLMFDEEGERKTDNRKEITTKTTILDSAREEFNAALDEWILLCNKE